jgi:hypothetical protein
LSLPATVRTKSIRQRIRNRLRERGEDVQFGLQRYAIERFLYRLGISPHRDRFVLKGATLFALWGGDIYRPTRDLDFTGYGDTDTVNVLDALREVCNQPGEPIELEFDLGSLTAEPIRIESEHQGLRIKFKARLGSSRIPMQIDIGFANAIQPPPENVEYPTLLGDPPPRIRAYPREAVVAEKLHAMVLLGERNSRLKDFYDLHALVRQFPFDGERLTGAIAATFKRRNTGIKTTSPVALTTRFYADEARATQWRAYLTRNALAGVPTDFARIGEAILAFLVPLWLALANGDRFNDVWKPGGSWKRQ